MDRRQFFKTVVATTVVAVVAPAVMKKRTGWENDVGGRWPDRAIICKARQMGMGGGHLVQFGRGDRSKMIYLYE